MNSSSLMKDLKALHHESFFSSRKLLPLFLLKEFQEASLLIRLAQVHTSEESLKNKLELLHFPTKRKGYCLPWQTNEGSLDKLFDYVALLGSTPKLNIASLKGFGHAIVKAQAMVEKALILLYTPEFSHTELKEFLEQMVHHQQVATRHLANFLSSTPQNENVILYLLKNRGKMEDLFGETVFASMLSTAFNGSLKELETFMVARFTGRGFKEIVLDIPRLVGELV